MKRILYLIAFSIIVFSCNSCGKVDNYATPSVTLKGSVIDSVTGKTVQTEIGGNGTRVKLMEISWSATPTPYYFYSMQDGTFNYTKLFAGKDIVTVEGPFVPLVQTDNTGNITVNKGKTVDIKGVTTLNFNVEPFLRVEWVSDPILNANGSITANIKFTRGTANPNFQLNITDVYLFVNATKYVGNNNYDNRYSTKVSYSGSNGNALIGQTVTITTNTASGALPGKRDYFLRVGARIQYGLNYYNYSEVKTVTVP